MQAQVNDVVVDEAFTKDTSSQVVFELAITLANGRLNPAQREALHKMMVQFARQARLSLMFAIPDPKLAKMELRRTSSFKGKVVINPFNDGD